MLSLEHITQRFHIGTPDEFTLFDDFNFTVQEGEFVAVIGSNGSGKTTLLNLVGGTLRPDAGTVRFQGRDITRLPEHKRAAFLSRVFQNPQAGTCGDLTILENMALADNKGKAFGLGRAVNKRRVTYYQSLLAACGMGLEDRLGVPVGNLSGGQRQALALVIAGMTDVPLLILDEHTAALDPKSSDTVMRLTDQLVAKKHITTLMVTHNLRFALEYGNRLVMMHAGRVVLDLSGDAKRAVALDDVLARFNQISIECGN